ncbi:NACHT domain- and WD repeat-containing protein 1-like [Ptychodera flava]|uniref:NACHT domain- and WD repeat-containing protein 1-like n=1 Tax=Ptychodera flava TaxID=63121 RepID=UPI00396A7E3A
MGCGSSSSANVHGGNTFDSVKATDKSQTDPRKIKILKGHFDIEYPSDAKIIRIFTSSTFTDTKHERDALMERVYPNLKRYCRSKGYEFQVVDMRWGIRDEATDDHMVTEICLREIEACQRLSTGPNFVTLLSHKYGQRPLLRTVDVSEFEAILQGVEDNDTKDLIKTWYRKDENQIPAVYVLQPISATYPDFKSNDVTLRKAAKAAWNETYDKLQTAFTEAAKVKLKDKNKVDKFILSVTAKEIDAGLLKVREPKKSCLWFHRVLKPVDQAPQDFIDIKRNTEDDVDKLLKELKDERIPAVLPTENIISYTVQCTSNGFDPSNVVDHKEYIQRFCSDFQQKLEEKVEQAIRERRKTEIDDPVFREALQHAKFCETKCAMFHGQSNALQKIKTYVTGNSNAPLVIYGPSGCGKTSLVAMAAKLTRKWLSGDAVTVLRFIGTTPDSTTLRRTLFSISKQISQVYEDGKTISEELKDLTKEFDERMRNASHECPLVLYLDSLDQFDPDDGAHQLHWLPNHLPENVKLVVSTLVDDKYECYPTLRANLKDEDAFLEVPRMKDEDIDVILRKWLSIKNRTLTSQQMKVLVCAFQKCPLPLFLKISFDGAVQWASYTDPVQTIVYQAIHGDTEVKGDSTPVRRVIAALFETVERNHGEMLVRRALAYITAAKSGLTENELEDILSCDDDVLNDVFQYWTPPIRRLPPLLWIRTRTDLAPYFVERGADGARVLYWYHRQFTEAAKDRYLADGYTTTLIHKYLADYFMGAWANGTKKPYKAKDGKVEERDRLVAAQPLVFHGGNYNLRKMNELPFHLIRSDQVDTLEKGILCNFDWLLTKMTATSVRRVLDDFKRARGAYPENERIATVAELLQLSHHALDKNPDQLASQIAARISKHGGLEDLLQRAMNPPRPCLVPMSPFLTRPGGMLVHSLAGHMHRIYGLDISESGKYAITGSYDSTVKLWNIEEGVMVKNIEEVGDSVKRIKFCRNDELFVFSALVDGRSVIKVFNTDTATMVSSLATTSDYPTAFAVTGGGRLLLVPERGKLRVFDLESMQTVKEVEDDFLLESGETAAVEAFGDVVAYYLTGDFDSKQVRVRCLSKPESALTIEVEFEKRYDARYSATVGGIALTAKKHLIICNQTKSNILIYDNYGEKLAKKIVDAEGGQGAHGSAASFTVTSDGRYLLVTRFDEVAIWDLDKDTKAVMLEHPYFIYRIASRDMKRVVSTSPDKLVRVWDITRGNMDAHVIHQDLKKLETLEQQEIKQLLCLPGVSMVTMAIHKAKSHNLVTVWDIRSLKQTQRLKVVSPKPITWKMLDENRVIAIVGNLIKVVNVTQVKVEIVFKDTIPNHMTRVALISDNRLLVALSEDGLSIKIHDVHTGEVVAELRHDAQEKVLDWRTNEAGKGDVLVSQLRKRYGVLYVWNTETREISHILKIDEKRGKVNLDNAAISAGGKYMAFITFSKAKKRGLLVYNLQTGKQLYHHRNNDVSVLDLVAVGEDKLIVQYGDKSTRILSFASGALLSCLDGHYEFVSQFEVSPNATRALAFSDRERKLTLWNSQDGSRLGSFTLEKKSKVQLMCNGEVIVVMNASGHVQPAVLRIHGEGYTPFPIMNQTARDAEDDEIDLQMTVNEKIVTLNILDDEDHGAESRDE